MDLPAELAHLNPDPALQEWMSDMLDQRQRDAATIKAANLKIQALTLELAHHRRIRFGNKSEAFSPEQRELFQETWDTDLGAIDLLFIENVGNLVCPASFDLGQHRNLTLLSVPEGDDKPAKYPVMFRAADAVVFTKTDLLPVFDDFSIERATRYLRELASAAPVLNASVRSAQGLAAWLDWLRDDMRALRARIAGGEAVRPAVQPDGAALHAAESAA